MAKIVYVLTNEVMPNIVKIGFTRDSVAERIKDLSRPTGVPLPFQCFYAAEVREDIDVERIIHSIFEDKRVSVNREFFYVSPERVRLTIKLAEIQGQTSDITPNSDLFETIEERNAIEIAVRRREARSPLRYNELGIPIGATLTFSLDDSITCSTTENNKVLYNGEVMSISGSALDVLRSLGRSWTSVQGGNFWKYNDETLVEIRDRLENESSNE
jgi:hypothetical protein